MMPSPNSGPQPSTPEPGIRQQAFNSPLGGMRAAISDGNVQIQINLQFNESPNHQADWIKLLEQTKENLTAILDKIGNIFIIFLKQPAAEEILFDSLIGLKEAISQTDEGFWQERDIQDWLVSLLEQCWRCH